MNCPDWSRDDPCSRGGPAKAAALLAYKSAMYVAGAGQAITPSHCRDWHLKFFRSVVPLAYYAGNFRQIRPEMPCLNVEVRVNGCQGSPAQNAQADVTQLFLWFNREWSTLAGMWPSLAPKKRAVFAAILIGGLVGRFVQIHPFVNGNGRLSRLLWAFALTSAGVDPQVRIRLRPTVHSYSQAMAAAMGGDFTPVRAMVYRHLSAHQT